MSYDLMVFNKDAAPKSRNDFMDWYDNQTEWTEDHGYDDPKVSSKELREWFLEIIQSFPPFNGPYSIDEESDRMADYSIGRDVIYVGFAWSQAEHAYNIARTLAAKHKVGFFDVSADEGDIVFP